MKNPHARCSLVLVGLLFATLGMSRPAAATPLGSVQAARARIATLLANLCGQDAVKTKAQKILKKIDDQLAKAEADLSNTDTTDDKKAKKPLKKVAKLVKAAEKKLEKALKSAVIDQACHDTYKAALDEVAQDAQTAKDGLGGGGGHPDCPTVHLQVYCGDCSAVTSDPPDLGGCTGAQTDDTFDVGPSTKSLDLNGMPGGSFFNGDCASNGTVDLGKAKPDSQNPSNDCYLSCQCNLD